MHIRSTEEERRRSPKHKKRSKRSFGISPPLSSKLIIPVRRYDPEVFRMLVQYVHCGMVVINSENVAGKLFYKIFFLKILF